MTVELRTRIAELWDDLTPAERRAAALVRADPDLLLLRTSAELAAETGTSKATISRLVRALGFRDALEVRETLLAARGAGLPWAATRADADQREIEGRNLDAALVSLTRADRGDLARRIAEARRVTVIGLRNAHPVALQLRAQLVQVRPEVRLAPVPGQSLGEELADLTSDDLVIIATIRRHPAGIREVIRHCVDAEADVVVITDPTGAVFAAGAATVLICPVDSPAAFDSLAAPMAVVAGIANDVYVETSTAGRTRIAAIADTYEQLDELTAS